MRGSRLCVAAVMVVLALVGAGPTSALVPVVPVVPVEVPLPPLPPLPSPVDARIASALTARVTPAAFGDRFSGQVVDAATGAVVWELNAGWPLRPASTAKLVTASQALATYGPRHRFTTSVLRGSSWGQVVLVGGGDPSLSSGDLAVLARGTAAQLSLHGVTRVKLWFDDSLFPRPSLATGWKAKYVPTDVRAVRALVVDEHHRADTSLDAALAFAGRLRRTGIEVTAVGRGRAPAGAPLVADVRGDRLDEIVARMLLTSDNDHAEALHRLVALGVGAAPTWAGSAAAQHSLLAARGLTVGPRQLYDGSGLSRSARLSAAQLVALVLDPVFVSGTSLPVSGMSGTLRSSLGRFKTAPSACAAGLVHAKTGSLDDVVALAGWTTDADGFVKAFAFVVNGKPDSLTLKRRVDALAATITGCY